MENGPKFTLIGSGIVTLIAIVIAIVGVIDTMEIDVEEYSIFKGTDGEVEVVKGGTYTVFVNDEFTCQQTEISVADDLYEYFEADCDSIMDEEGWRAIGVFYTDTNGNLDVQSNHEILIIDDMTYLEEGAWSVLGGCCFVCIGLIGLIIGAAWAYSSKPVTQMVVMPQGVQPQMQVPVAPGYTPGNLVITQQEEEPGA
ncbi:MAG: hypothetical protein OSB33_03145 [Candidatus Poseidoniales archaeon]|nr:hypothetical protein [Candidatus Poseidoniales archaeon]